VARRRQSAFEDLIGIAAALPWWAGVSLAAISYAVLSHYAAATGPAIPTDIAGLGQAMQGQVLRTAAHFGQYILPAAFGLGAAISGIRKIQRARVLRTVTGGLASVGESSSKPPSRVADAVNWHEFEQLVGEVFRLRGYKVTETGSAGGDGGIDLVAIREGERYFVQCKQWGARRVGVKPVRELAGVIAREGAIGGFVVTNGEFTEEAIRFAKGSKVTLLDESMLRAMLDSGRGKQPKAQAPPSASEDTLPIPLVSAAPVCPVCSGEMVRRVAKRGKSVGESFWGCASYPRCRGTRPDDQQRPAS